MLTLASGASYLVNEYLLGTELFYLRTLSFIVVIAGIVQFTEMFIHKTSPVLYQVLGIYLPLITTNCAVLGIPLLNVQAQHNFVESLFFGAGGAIGFTLVLVLFAGIRERLDTCDVPAPFKGTSIGIPALSAKRAAPRASSLYRGPSMTSTLFSTIRRSTARAASPPFPPESSTSN